VADLSVEAVATATQVSLSTELELQILRLNRQFWNAVDVEDWAGLLDMLTDDVDYQLAGLCRGKSEVAEALKRRPELHAARHLVTNELVRQTEDGFELTFIAAAYSYLPRPGMTPPYPTPAPIIFDGRATIRSQAGALKFAMLSAAPFYMSEYHLLAAATLARG
jgi:hypothetical protein